LHLSQHFYYTKNCIKKTRQVHRIGISSRSILRHPIKNYKIKQLFHATVNEVILPSFLSEALAAVMFKKPLANLKSFSPLRSSDRRRFQNEAYEAYPSVKAICSNTTEEGGASTHLMPDDLRSAKFISHTGTSGIVYMSEKQTLWISVENLPPIPTGKLCV
jgi:hypothetical protein